MYESLDALSEVVIPETEYFAGILKNQLFALLSLLSIPKVFIFTKTLLFCNVKQIGHFQLN